VAEGAGPEALAKTLPANGGSRPVPDPTELTDRAIARLEKSLTIFIEGKIEVVEQRLEGMDTAVKLAQGGVERMPARVDEKSSSLKELLITKIDALNELSEERFAAAERQRVEQKSDTKAAVDAALSAAKEAVKEQTTASERSIDKSEKATGETIKTNQELNQSKTDALTKEIDGVKERIGRIENIKVGATENRTGTYAVIGAISTILGILLTAAAILALVRP
jgi:hypothetical protein